MPPPDSIAVVGPGRLGHAISAALTAAGVAVEGPLGRGDQPTARVILLTVPDRAIAEVAAAMPDGRLVGHCSGARPLGGCAFSLHPLMTVPASGACFEAVPAAVDGHAVATELALLLGMRPFRVADRDRAAYHAAASMASNLLVILESAAERVAATAGVDREMLVPLVRATVDNWARDGRAALTGPIARGDTETIALHRSVLGERTPELVELYEVLAAC